MLVAESIREYCHKFKLSAILESFEHISDKASEEQISYSEYLYRLLEIEDSARAVRAKRTLLKLSGVPKIKNIDSFDFKSSSVDRTLIGEILTLRFIDKCKNILLLGPSGVGKTHLATAIAYEATQSRIKTKFLTASDLIIQLESAQSKGELDNYLRRVIAPARLLIIDELGYVKFNENQANLFFQIVNKKYETGSIVITSNLSFSKWKEVLNSDEALTAAVLDRLIHHSYMINISGESYRLKQKREAGLLGTTSR